MNSDKRSKKIHIDVNMVIGNLGFSCRCILSGSSPENVLYWCEIVSG